MVRLTRKRMDELFKVHCKRVGLPMAESYNDVGKYQLDYYQYGGGYCIQQIANESGGIHNVTARYSAKEMAAYFTIAHDMCLAWK